MSVQHDKNVELIAQRRVNDEHCTLWDQFAMAALTGLCAGHGYPSNLVGHDKQKPGAFAEVAFEMADAMMIEHRKRLARKETHNAD